MRRNDFQILALHPNEQFAGLCYVQYVAGEEPLFVAIGPTEGKALLVENPRYRSIFSTYSEAESFLERALQDGSFIRGPQDG